MDKIKGFARRHRLIAFLVLAYAITWVVWIPAHSLKYAALISAWGAFGPALAGIFITSSLPERDDFSAGRIEGKLHPCLSH
jgi:hypothetical protein